MLILLSIFFENLKVTFSFIFITKKKMGSKKWKNANDVRVLRKNIIITLYSS